MINQLKTLTLERLSGARVRDVALLQTLLEQAPRYFRTVTGVSAGPNAATDLLFPTALPPGKSAQDQLVIGAFSASTLIACAALLSGYPSPPVTFIGLLLVAEPWEGQGYGSCFLRRLTGVLQSCGTCDRLRLAVLGTNERAQRFWLRQGFTLTGEREPFSCGDIHAETLFYERAIRTHS